MRNFLTFASMKPFRLDAASRRRIADVHQRRTVFAIAMGRTFEKPHIVRVNGNWVCAKKGDLRTLIETQGATYRPFGSANRPDLALHSWALGWLMGRPLSRGY